MNLYTELKDRQLWFDGDSTFPTDNINNLLQLNGQVCVEQLTNEIRQYNTLVPTEKQITVKQSVREFDFSWHIPEKYITLNLSEYIYQKLADVEISERLTGEQMIVRAERTAVELNMFKRFNLYDVLRAIVYVIETFESKDVVWGVGRGSCVSSYVLYLIGVHDIDSVEYDLDITDFLHN